MQFEQSEMLKRLPEQFFAKLVKKAQHLQKQGHDVINLGQGNPDLPTPEHIVKALENAADKPVNHKYPPFRGFKYVKQAMADFYQREYGVHVDPKTEVALLFGSKAGFAELAQCLLNPGDTALLPDPGYPDYMSGMVIADAETSFMPLLAENDFLPDYSKLDEETMDRAKVMFLNYPNNPTSATATKEFFDETIDLAKKHHFCVVHDFAYAAIGFEDKKPQSFLQSEGAKDAGIEIYTLSKTYNMAGWRIGFAIGNPSVIANLQLLHDHLYVSLFGAVQEGAAAALNGDQEPVRKLNEIYANRRKALFKALDQIGWKNEPPKGTFFAWLKVPEGYTSEEFADLLLEKAHVVVAPGNGFGSKGEGYVRVALLATEERIQEAMERIGELGIFN